MRKAIWLWMVVACCACGKAQTSTVSISARQFDSLYRITGSSFSGERIQLLSTQGQYIAVSIDNILLDTVAMQVRLSGLIDSVGSGSYPEKSKEVQDVSIVIGYLKQHTGDTVTLLGYDRDRREQQQRQELQERIKKMTPQEHIRWVLELNRGVGSMPISSIEIKPIASTHPAIDGKFVIEAHITRDAYLIIDKPHGPAAVYMLGAVLAK